MANNASTNSADCTYHGTMQVVASKTKIYMVLEYVTGGELFDKIVRSSYFDALIQRQEGAYANGFFYINRHKGEELKSLKVESFSNS